MAMLVLVFVICSFVAISLGQVPGVGKCPQVEVMKDFNVKNYYGKWYEVTKFYTSFENGQKCNTATYTPKDDGHFVVFNTGLNEKRSKSDELKNDYENFKIPLNEALPISLNSRNVEGNATGDGYVPDATVPAKIKVKFSSASPYADYWVLDTDYETYTLIYSCVDVLGISHLEFSWILSRKPTLEPEVIQKLFNLVESFGIKSSNFKDDDQLSCPWSIY